MNTLKKHRMAVLLVVGALAAWFLIKRKGKSSAAADNAVPFTPSSYFYADPMGGAGANYGDMSAGGGTASTITPPASTTDTGPQATRYSDFRGTDVGIATLNHKIGVRTAPVLTK